MRETHRGSPDGLSVYTYEANTEYDLPVDLAAVFIRERWAEEIDELPLPKYEKKIVKPNRKKGGDK